MDSNGLHKNKSTERLVRQECSYASDVFRGLYLNERTANVFFTFQNSNERVPADKHILSMASSVFDKMFYGPSAVSGDIPIVGYPPEAFKGFLQFFYLNEVTLKSSNITDVGNLLHAYKMPKCLEICSRFWFEHYDDGNIDDICLAYEYAIKLQIVEFQRICEHKIAIYFVDAMKTDSFLSCSFGVLDRILGFDSLLCDESLVLSACLDWARYKCKQNDKDENDMKNLRDYLIDNSNGANLLYKIRYGSISHAEYLTHLNEIDAIFVDGMERTDIARLVLGSTDMKTSKFRTKPRKPFWVDERAINHMLPKKEYGLTWDIKERIVHVLKTNRFILFGSFYTVQMRSTNLRSRYILFNVSIDEQRNGDANKTVTKLIHSGLISVTENTNELVQLKPNPVVMNPGCEYHIAFDFKLNHGDDDKCDDISFLDGVESNHEIVLKEDLTIQFGSVAGKKGRLLIRGFKLMQL